MSRKPGFRMLGWFLAGALAGCVVAPYPPAPVSETAATPVVTDEPEEQAPEPPPPLPVYEQPPCPVEGYIWAPGVWRWGPDGYFWVPGTWVAPPQVGFLWTPGYWGLVGVVYVFHPGHWGPHVGYYGGIDYGHGYDGDGYHGGRWVNNRFQYNVAVTNVNVLHVHNTYNETVIRNVNVTNPSAPRVSYVGGPGTRPRPTAAEENFARERRYAPTAPQLQHHTDARGAPLQNATRNEGRPPIAATPRPSAFYTPGIAAAKPVGEPYRPQRPMPQEGKPKEGKPKDERHDNEHR